MSALGVRGARIDDCAALGSLRARCIRQLCVADHNGDPAAIAAWAGDGGAGKFLDLLNQPEVTLLLAERDGQAVGLGASFRDMVTLNYVDPDFRFMGVSKAIMSALEADMLSRGVSLARLDSTKTALSFYQTIGWRSVGDATPRGGIPMTKRLQR